jgi:hypothetical protein
VKNYLKKNPKIYKGNFAPHIEVKTILLRPPVLEAGILIKIKAFSKSVKYFDGMSQMKFRFFT